MSSLLALIRDVDDARAGSEETDVTFAETVLGWYRTPITLINPRYRWHTSLGVVVELPHFSTDVSAMFGAIPHLLPGFFYGVRFGTAEDEDGHEEGPAHYASVFEYDGWVGHVNDDEEDGAVEYRGNTAALALMLATLRAVESKRTGHGR